MRLAIVVSHPIQYFIPLYRRLARRDDLDMKVFFTWHAGQREIEDRGFGQRLLWDIPLTDGYEFEAVANVSAYPGPYRFFGLHNPTLLDQVMSWRPDVVHVSGWAWYSHVRLLRMLYRSGVPTLFAGDSHLLDDARSGPRWWTKAAVLRHVYSWPSGVLFVGTANRAYYERFGVGADRLLLCPHSIDVSRFAVPAAKLEEEAARWRAELGIGLEERVLLYAGKFERKKRPLELMRAVARLDRAVVLVMLGAGELQAEVDAVARANPSRFRALPFQNQSRMPVAYRLGDIFVLPSACGESWGLAINEAMACGRPVVVSDRVGCAGDIIDSTCGRIFPWNDWSAFGKIVEELIHGPSVLADMRRCASKRAWEFDTAAIEPAFAAALNKVVQSARTGATCDCSIKMTESRGPVPSRLRTISGTVAQIEG